MVTKMFITKLIGLKVVQLIVFAGPTDCTGDQNHTFCGITFHCKCIWKMPTYMEAETGCGVHVQPYDGNQIR